MVGPYIRIIPKQHPIAVVGQVLECVGVGAVWAQAAAALDVVLAEIKC